MSLHKIPREILFEQSNERMDPSNPNKVNAPTFIYWVLYDKYPPRPLFGRGAAHKEKVINGVGIDKVIPSKAIKKLFKMKEIECRSSCQGSDENMPTFLIIRLRKNTKSNVKRFVSKINKYDDIKANYDVGNNGQYRIGITNHLWYSPDKKKEFVKWWLELPEKIKRSM